MAEGLYAWFGADPKQVNQLLRQDGPYTDAQGLALKQVMALIIAQRLARRLCSHCKQQEHLPEVELLKQGFTAEQLPTVKIFKPVGCEHCTNGYKGRVGIYEVMPITAQIAAKIMAGANSLDIAAQAQIEGFPNLRQSALKKAAAGFTSLAEVNRVTNA